MAGLDLATHAFAFASKKDVDARDSAGMTGKLRDLSCDTEGRGGDA
jgi:hypothetical protein